MYPILRRFFLDTLIEMTLKAYHKITMIGKFQKVKNMQEQQYMSLGLSACLLSFFTFVSNLKSFHFLDIHISNLFLISPILLSLLYSSFM